MCGIVGVALPSPGSIVENLLNPLKKLEYRGYDSCGIYTRSRDEDSIHFEKELGSVSNLRSYNYESEITIGIGHTRWATHGKVDVTNAHPHTSNDRVSIVHNGVIDNYSELKKKLKENYNYEFTSETDTEVISHLIHKYLTISKCGYSLVSSVAMSTIDLSGKYSFVVSDHQKQSIVGYKNGRPLIVFKTYNGIYISSDVASFQGMDKGEIYFLEDDQIVEIFSNGKIDVYNKSAIMSHKETPLKIKMNPYTPEQFDSSTVLRTIMESEIYQQSTSIRSALDAISISDVESMINHLHLPSDPRQVKINLIGCGTSYHAALLGARWLKELAGIDAVAEVSSEFAASLDHSTSNLYILLSQSGETADTLSALDKIDQITNRTISICNVSHSELVRRTNIFIPINAGIERSVASTKAFTGQLVALLKISIVLGNILNRGIGNLPIISKDLEQSIEELPNYISETLSSAKVIRTWASDIFKKDISCAIFLGRGNVLPVMLEGALKFSEIVYIPGLTYSTGELKHGPLALINNGEPVITVVSRSEPHREKIYSTLKQVESRGGKIFLIGEQEIIDEAESKGVVLSGICKLPRLPRFDHIFLPFLSSIPLQIFAHESALHLGNSVDTPRNLAKSVTVY